MIDSWCYYNHAAIPTCAPHEEADLSPIADGSIWRGDFLSGGGKPLFARWTSNWDCGYETNWWYVIKDTPFNLDSIKAKRRYEITKGNRNFEVKVVDYHEYIDQLYGVTVAAYSGWGEKCRPQVNRDSCAKLIREFDIGKVYGAFERKSGRLCGYAVIVEKPTYAVFSRLRTCPQEEKFGINAAIIYGILTDYSTRLKDGYYICDGSRSIRHETRFQDYLRKYFEFRNAYCFLHLKYQWFVKVMVKILFPFRGFIKGKSKVGSLIKGVLTMEEIVK